MPTHTAPHARTGVVADHPAPSPSRRRSVAAAHFARCGGLPRSTPSPGQWRPDPLLTIEDVAATATGEAPDAHPAGPVWRLAGDPDTTRRPLHHIPLTTEDPEHPWRG